MNNFEKHLKKFWLNDRKRSNNIIDEINEPFLPQTSMTTRTINIQCFYRLCYWIYTHKCLFFFLILICLPIILYLSLSILRNNRAFIPIEFQQNQYRLLLIVAHPDDECLFFSPTLRVLQNQYHVNLSLLVFSRGNHVGLGDIRAKELLGSCRTLHIPQERCISLNLPNIQDNPKVWWSEQQLIPIINDHITKWGINALVSFDNQGISGHINHRSVAFAVRRLTQNKTTNTMIKMSYELKSVSLLRKYSSLLDCYFIFLSFIPRLLHSFISYIIPFNLISSPSKSRMLLINTPNDYIISRNAFANHQTQYSWDRHIYLLASRYMFINELKYIDKNK